MKKDLEELLLCQCESPEHQIIFIAFDDEPEVYMEIHLAPLPFWERLIRGIKYIFGYRCKYGDFDEVILRSSDKEKLQKVVEHL